MFVFCFIGFITVLLLLCVTKYSLFRAEKYGIALSIIAVLATIIPATDIAVNFVNWVLCKMIKPSLLPKLDFETEYLKSMPQWLSYLLCFLTRIGRGS